jgi:hypothetical protein
MAEQMNTLIKWCCLLVRHAAEVKNIAIRERSRRKVAKLSDIEKGRKDSFQF